MTLNGHLEMLTIAYMKGASSVKKERDAAIARAEAAESAQRECTAEVARLREAVEYYAVDYDHERKCSQWDGGAKARAALASKE